MQAFSILNYGLIYTYLLPLQHPCFLCGFGVLVKMVIVVHHNYWIRITVLFHLTGPEPMVQLVRFWPDHFLLGARPLLVNAWDRHCTELNRSNEMLWL